MDLSALRTWGVATSAALIVGAVALSLQPRADGAQAAPVLEFAQAPTRAEPVSFLVRFQGGGPIARAQAAAARGGEAQAQRTIEVQLRRQRAFAGLCFDRFTAGAAEVVLRTCAAIVPSERATVQQQWLTRLRAMRAVAYADANIAASQNRAG